MQFICEYSIHILLANKADSPPAETAELCRAATSENGSETGPTPEQSTIDGDPRCTKTQTRHLVAATKPPESNLYVDI